MKVNILNRQLPASTLMEVLVAMVVVMIAFGLSVMIYTGVMNSSNYAQRVNAYLLLKDIAAEVKKERNFLDNEIEEESMKINVLFTPYEGNNKRLQQMHLKAMDINGKMLAERKELILLD